LAKSGNNAQLAVHQDGYADFFLKQLSQRSLDLLAIALIRKAGASFAHSRSGIISSAHIFM